VDLFFSPTLLIYRMSKIAESMVSRWLSYQLRLQIALPPTPSSVEVADRSASNSIIRELFHSFAEHESYMSEIQLRRIVDKMASGATDQGTDGDEVVQKGGETISKFSKEALEIGAPVSEVILDKVRKVFDLNKGDVEVFRTNNGAPKIMTKFKDKPYS
jgi:hypothetical protein